MRDLERMRHHRKTWNRFLEAERRALEHRRNGQLSRLLGSVSPTSESAAWELVWLAQEDQETAEEGLVELRTPGGEIEHKHIDALSRRDYVACLEAERVRIAWIASAQRSGVFPAHT